MMRIIPVLIAAILGFGGAGYAQDAPLSTTLSPAERLNQLRQSPFRIAQAYDCRNVSCKKLSSCAEACYKLKVCGQKIRDRDRDGIPCENLCSQPCP
ncbi:hypothetical protein XMM379_002887 [Aliiroseovarius sp. xm-m-379]|nr:hypothetical protein [Aliiroseovarius sp. xm-d-517]NRP26178.1 hypothetical protein [Aliiroseovarius sp. xm-m-379]NRP31661.1 hypothetical protein [Aliiroseovarius sp. xm-m-314]NRP34977.1 hypothetical protein [Aliiroseovarius sp. xm-a-104]NRP42204.1 hypothetical protein [Aliiroseovarius sp. xm-m-339-2]NRP45636.1 hypothetical protein [Aliiroseovarius sp. xm-m-378]NRP51245.1 hypothetical protein [Aliiroseovarius sp. xm-m-354]NRP63211.1 hypothetical protein [Aliiroseovarius sp. xm-a-151]NRP66